MDEQAWLCYSECGIWCNRLHWQFLAISRKKRNASSYRAKVLRPSLISNVHIFFEEEEEKKEWSRKKKWFRVLIHLTRCISLWLSVGKFWQTRKVEISVSIYLTSIIVIFFMSKLNSKVSYMKPVIFVTLGNDLCDNKKSYESKQNICYSCEVKE